MTRYGARRSRSRSYTVSGPSSTRNDENSGLSARNVPIRGYAGHGTFVAGVARCMAPVSRVRVSRDFDKAGALSEHELVKRLGQALGLGADVINLSAGGTTRKNLPLLSFVAFWETYRHYKGVVLVASAGNNSTRRPFWPAAFPQVVGWARLPPIGGPGRFSAISGRGWTCTHLVRTWSTRMPLERIPAANHPILARCATSTAWRGGAGLLLPRHWSPA